MAKKTAPLLPGSTYLLERLGERLRTARLRRKLSAKQVAERAGMAPMTLRGVERGGAGVTIGAYLAVMQVLGIEKDLELVGQADPVGRELQDARLPWRTRRTDASLPAAEPHPVLGKQADEQDDWIEQGEFTSADALAGLIEPPAVSKPNGR